METMQTEIAIVGGGPAGLMLAIELGCRDVPCVLLEEDADPPAFPKANATSARTMEHYRRRGFSDEVRALGLPPDYPQDVVYCTQLADHELARFRIPSRSEAARRSALGDLSTVDAGDYGREAWPTPELPHRVQQMLIEPVLRARAAAYASVRLCLGQRAISLEQDDHGVTLLVEPSNGGAPWRLRARYVVGCDGPRSMVRKAMGVGYTGESRVQRDFFGGQMLSIYFRSRTLYGVIGKPPAWQYWAVNARQRGLLIAIDGVQTFLLAVQLAPGQGPADIDPRAVAHAVVGREFDFELIDRMPWVAGYMLVAEKMAAGRVFLAGDAAHLFTPTGGMGYNTSIDDAVNLGGGQGRSWAGGWRRTWRANSTSPDCNWGSVTSVAPSWRRNPALFPRTIRTTTNRSRCPARARLMPSWKAKCYSIFSAAISLCWLSRAWGRPRRRRGALQRTGTASAWICSRLATARRMRCMALTEY